MEKIEIFQKAETALLKQLEILSENMKQPFETEQAIKAIPVLLDVILKLR